MSGTTWLAHRSTPRQNNDYVAFAELDPAEIEYWAIPTLARLMPETMSGASAGNVNEVAPPATAYQGSDVGRGGTVSQAPKS